MQIIQNISVKIVGKVDCEWRDYRDNNKEKIIASICVAALPLGESDILRGKNATTYRGKRQKQLSEFGVNVVDKPIVIEGNVITSWNPATAIDVALHLLEKLTDKQNTKYIRKIMGFTS